VLVNVPPVTNPVAKSGEIVTVFEQINSSYSNAVIGVVLKVTVTTTSTPVKF
jgi:hypothetical protein